MDRVNAEYRAIAKEFAARVQREMGQAVDSIVLYGSVARGEAGSNSDIDILLIADSRSAYERASDIREQVMYEHNYDALITLLHYTREELNRVTNLGSPFIENVLDEGVVLHDNGTFAGVRKKLLAVRG